MSPVTVNQGQSPLILTMPHTGISLPDDVFEKLNDRGKKRSDTDWNIHLLYDGLIPDATTVRANFHRYVIDPNRDPSGASLYPGQNTTALCPLTDFDGHTLYIDGKEPDEDEIKQRRSAFHAPYHAAIKAEIVHVVKKFGYALLYDCHSIRSHVPYLFEGKLPDFNIGTFDGVSCGPEIEHAVVDTCARAQSYTHVLNGRFKGGWTTRFYGDPENGVHAVQMELAQSTYMDEIEPWAYRDDLAARVRPHLKSVLERLLSLTV